MAYGDIDSLLRQQRQQPPPPPVSTDPFAPIMSQINASRQQIAAATATPAAPAAPRPSFESQVAKNGLISSILDRMGSGMAGATPPSPTVAVTPPGTRTATQGAPAPNAVPMSAAPGSMDQYGSLSPNAPATTGPVRNQETIAQMALARTLGPGMTADTGQRGNAGIATLAGNPTAQSQFNDLQAARNNGITAATGPNGQLVLSGDGAKAGPQNFTAGFDLAGANARQMASQDSWNDHVMKGQIADLVTQLPNAGPVRAAQIQQQIGTLAGTRNAGIDAASKAGLTNAQTGLTNAQTQSATQANSLSAANAKQLTKLHDQFIGETDPAKSKTLQEKILTLMGKDPKDPSFQIVTQDELNDPSQPLLGSHKVAAIVDQRTGIAQSLNDALSNGMGAKAPGGATPLPNHLAALKANPKLAPQFDAMYGPGASKRAGISG